MSTELSTIEGKGITSYVTGVNSPIADEVHLIADNGKEQRWDYREFCPVLRKTWEEHLKNRKRPNFLGYNLTPDGFVELTWHYLKSGMYGKQTLPEVQSLAYWLLSVATVPTFNLEATLAQNLKSTLEGLVLLSLAQQEKSKSRRAA